MIKDSFDKVLKFHQISPEVFDNGYIFVSFDVNLYSPTSHLKIQI